MYQVFNLSEIAEATINEPKQYLANTIGCIVDISRPLFRIKQQNYITQVKIVDESLNESSQTSHLAKYLSVYLISDKREELKLTSKIGDFIYLHKFMVSMWNNIKLIARYYGGFESFYQIHSGELEDHQHLKIQKVLGKQAASYDVQLICGRITQLKVWLRVNFKAVFGPFLGVKIINNYCCSVQPFSMILRSIRIQRDQFQQHMFLADTQLNLYYIDIKQFNHLLFHERQWIYLRGIKSISVDRQIILTASGNILQLPQLFLQHYQLQANYQAIYRKTNKITNQKKETTALTYITLFQQKVSTVRHLYELQDKFKATTRKEHMILQNNYLVKGAVVNYTGNIKLYHTQHQMIVHRNYLEEIPSQQKRQTISDKRLVYIFEGTLIIMDRSVASRRQLLKVKLFSNDLKSTFFDQKQLQKLVYSIGYSNNEQKIQESLRNINAKLQKLKEMSSFQSPASLVLEPIRSDELIFRLINTKIA